MYKLLSAAVVCAALVGCGVSDDAVLSELDSDDWASLCSGRAVEAETATCDWEGTEVEIEIEAASEEDCASDSLTAYGSCDATAGDYNSCMDAFDLSDICELEIPAECDALMACLTE
jgi:hypothetical protein